jgi:hypothetical protein
MALSFISPRAHTAYITHHIDIIFLLIKNVSEGVRESKRGGRRHYEEVSSDKEIRKHIITIIYEHFFQLTLYAAQISFFLKNIKV